MKKLILFLLFFLTVTPCHARELGCTKAKCIRADTTNFDNNLSGADTRVQTALETLDDMASGGATAWDDITNPDAADEIDFGAHVTELNVEDFRIGDGGANYIKFGGAIITFAGTYDIDLPDDSIDDADINLGTGAGQVSAVDLPIADAGSIITATEVEGALQENRTAINSKAAHAGQAYTGTQDFQAATFEVDTVISDDEIQFTPNSVNTAIMSATGSTLQGDWGMPNTAGDLSLDAVGDFALDSTQKQIGIYDGTEVAIPLRHMIYGNLNLADWHDVDTEKVLIELDATIFPDGIVITSWEVGASVADPTTELDMNLRYCDDNTTGAFPGASEVLVDVMDTTTGNSSEADMSNSDLGSGVIPTAKILYLDMDADPTDATTFYTIKIEFYIPES